MLGRILQIVSKEFIELRRDKWARFRLLVPPIIQVLVFGYAATFEVFGVSTTILDLDHTQESRELIAAFTNSSHFKIREVAGSQREVQASIDESRAQLALVVHAGFANLLRKGQSAPLQVLVDGTNSNTALIALGYANEIVAAYSDRVALDLMYRTRPSAIAKQVQVSLDERPWYNTSFNSRWFFVPGVVATLTLVMVVNLTAFAIVREREAGTLEQLMVTPVRPFDLIVGKTIPFFIIGLTLVTVITLVGTLWFRIPFRGSPLVLLLGTSVYLLSTLALGLAISTICKTQQQAFATNFFVVNPLFTLSGFSFPISSMPDVLQWLTWLDPVRYFLVIIRGTFLKGVGVSVLWPQLLALLVLGAALMSLAVLRFRKSLD
ncbi:MAG TPA: ABC transporter permease [Steroidobacteraceae bacterium]|jgi:ABC-2 type transport system permease protein|nr:ABC transporter permease [Steroidobacteraceae bacterium]